MADRINHVRGRIDGYLVGAAGLVFIAPAAGGVTGERSEIEAMRVALLLQPRLIAFLPLC